MTIMIPEQPLRCSLQNDCPLSKYNLCLSQNTAITIIRNMRSTCSGETCLSGWITMPVSTIIIVIIVIVIGAEVANRMPMMNGAILNIVLVKMTIVCDLISYPEVITWICR